MNLFQLITLPIALILFSYSVFSLVRGFKHRIVSIFGAIIWLLAGVSIYNPDITMKIARAFGIGRGADLILYLLVLLSLLTVLFFYNKIKTLESDISKIIRHLAIDSAVRDESGKNVEKLTLKNEEEK